MLVAAKRHLLRREVEEILRRYIRESELKENDHLPPQRDLADALQVSRTVVREALSSLEAQGVIEILPGSGVIVRNPDLALNAVPVEVKGPPDLNDHSSQDMLDFVYSQYLGFADMICQRATEGDIRGLEQRLVEMDTLLREGKTILREVQDFFWALIELTRNSVIAELQPLFSEVNRRGLLAQPSILGRPTDRAQEHLTCHRAIVQAIRERDARALGEHLRMEFGRMMDRS